jgi:hypothetical protein
MSKRPKKIVIIPIILILIAAAVLLVIPIYAATSLSVIQVKGNTSAVLSEAPDNTKVPATDVEFTTQLSEKILYMDGTTGESFRLEALVLPDTATLKTVKWKASSDAVSINAEGENNQFCVITARKASENVTITASDEMETQAVTFKIIVKVNAASVQAELVPQAGYSDGNPINVINTKTNKFKLRAKVFPEDASSAVKWESLSPKRVSIDVAGNVVIAKDTPIGIYDVRVTALDGDKSAIKRIKVNQGVKEIFLYPTNNGSPNNELHALDSVDTIYLKIVILPANAYNKKLDVSLTLPKDGDGEITEIVGINYQQDKNRIRVKGGYDILLDGDEAPAVITAKSTDGSGVKASYKIWTYEVD